MDQNQYNNDCLDLCQEELECLEGITGNPAEDSYLRSLAWLMAKEPRFKLGTVYVTAAAMKKVPPHETCQGLFRHLRGDWGDVPELWQLENELCLKSGRKIQSIFRTSSGVTFWVITEGNRLTTTILLPEDY